MILLLILAVIVGYIAFNFVAEAAAGIVAAVILGVVIVIRRAKRR